MCLASQVEKPEALASEVHDPMVETGVPKEAEDDEGLWEKAKFGLFTFPNVINWISLAAFFW